MVQTKCLRDDELNKITTMRHTLIRQYEKHEIDDLTYIEKMKELDEQNKKRLIEVINIQNDRLVEKEKILEENKMDEKQKQAMAAGRKINPNSNAQLILKALQMASVKTYEDVAKKVLEWKPDIKEGRIKAMAKTMVREIVAGKGGKAKNFKWNEEQFLLVKNE